MKTLLPAILLAVAVPAVSQPATPEFWRKPGETIRDAKGAVLRQEVKDPKTFTMKVFEHGDWITYRYQPNTEKITRAETSDTAEDLLYDGDDWNGLTMHAGAKKYTLRVRGGKLTADGLGALSILHDDDHGRDVAIRYDTASIGNVEYAPSGEITRVTLGSMALDFKYASASVTETLTANGEVLVTRTVTPSPLPHVASRGVSLAPVADRIGLGQDWFNKISACTSSTGSLITITDDKQQVVARIVQFGGQRAAYDASGQPLFFDVELNYNDVGRKVVPFLGLLPTRFVVTVDGEVAAYLSDPDEGAIGSFWSSTENGQKKYHYTISHSQAKRSALAAGPTGAPLFTSTSTQKRFSSGRFAAVPQMMMQCGLQEQWDCCNTCGYGGGAYCEDNYYPVYCDSGGYSYVSPDPYTGGGGGGGSLAGNQVLGDAQLRVAVNAALSQAQSKVSNAQCGQALFQDMLLNDGTPVSSVLALLNKSSADWLGSLTWKNGTGVKDPNNVVPCDSDNVKAWMNPPGSTVDYLCGSFKTLGASLAAVTLIHEELHSLGLSEAPQDPNARYTATQIQQAVQAHCGS